MKFGFIAHPTSQELLHQVKMLDMTGRMLEEQANGYDPALWRQRNLVPFVEFTRIVSACGAQCEGILQFMPLTAEQMLSQPRRIAERVVEGVNALKNEGAELVGLGGFTSIVGNRGQQTLERTQVPVTTGNSLTAYATYMNLLEVLSALDIAPEQAEVAILGYPGSIGLAVARLLAPKGCRLHLVHRDERQQPAVLLDYLPASFHQQVTLHPSVEACYDKIKLFVAATSSGNVIDSQRLMPGSVIIDAALPKDTQPGWEKRDDILVIDGGLVSASDAVSFGAMALGLDPKRNLNGCLAETILLSLEKRAEPFSLGRELPVERVLEIGRIAERHGFYPRPLTSQGEAVSDATFHTLRRFHGGQPLAASGSGEEDAQHLRAEVLRCFGEHINPVLREFYEFNHVERVFNHGEGCWLTDLDGRRYLDFLAGYGCLNTGHNHPGVTAKLQEYLAQQHPTFVQYLSAPLHASLLAKRLSDITPGELERVFLSNSGTEAVEAALKLAMAASDKPTLLYCANGYHGKTLGALSVTGREKHRTVFKPLLSRCEEIPFGDIDALQARLQKGDVMGFIMEPIQGEGGVIMPPEGYLSAVRALCSEHECLWILDEIQTGLGRTGKMFACQWEEVSPDIMVLSKSLSGGMVPIGATLSSKAVWQRAYGNIDRFALHTSTFGGGNFAAAAAALASLDVIEQEDLPGNARQVGAYLRQGLDDLARKHYFIKEVRGRGMMLAVEFQNDVSGGIEAFVREMTSRLPAKAAATYRMMPMKAREHLEAAMEEMESTMADIFVLRIMTKLSQEHHILTFVTANNNRVMRIQPPLILSLDQAERFINALGQVCEDLSTFEA